MDTTKTRIKKLAKYTHLQKVWKPKNHDYCRHYDLEEDLDVGVIGENTDDDGAFYEPIKDKNRFIWLPRIDQHIVILDSLDINWHSGKTKHYKIGKPYRIDYFCKIHKIFNLVKSIEAKKEVDGFPVRTFRAKTLEQAFDEACEWVLQNKEK